MPRGQPDYGITTQTPVASGISDPGEAAARLGSINVYDRRGWTVWMDDFEAPAIRWTPGSSVGGTLPVLSTTRAWMGAQSLYFTTAGVAASYASVYKRFPLLRTGKVGAEFFIYLDTRTPGNFLLRLNIQDGVNVSLADLKLDAEARTATIVTSTGDVVVAMNYCNTIFAVNWVPVKLVVDMDTDRFVRLMIGPAEIDLSSYSMVAAGATTNKMILAILQLNGDVVSPMYAWVDNFILTQNEP